MKMIWTGLLAVFMLFCLADAQYYQSTLQRNPVPPPVSRYPIQSPPIYQPPKTQNPLRSPQLPLPPRLSHPALEKDRSPTCQVAGQDKVECGSPLITASDCQAIKCCFDGKICYFGKYVTLQCTKDAQFILAVSRDATLPSLDLDSIAFHEIGEACKPKSKTAAFVIYQFPVSHCGTTFLDESGAIIYENTMSSSYEVAVGQNGAITRDSSFELLFRCIYRDYPENEVVAVEVSDNLSPQPIAALGPLRVELRLANGLCTGKGCLEEDVAYSSFYTDADYPVTKVLRDPVYVDVRMLERTDPDIALTLGRCWANSSPQPDNHPHWDLLINGCPYRDDNYQTQLAPVEPSQDVLYPAHHKRFIFKMFTFVSQANNPSDGDAAVAMIPLKEKVYIHCETAVCQLIDENSCKPRCFRNRREIAASDQKGQTDDPTVVSSHELVITRQ
ncbi:zona pellucida sperm-binding protein 4-like [Brachionichthys hirsutus]|uniref:zona pellucida sperm-binding protein 4-like n=1 Tax=Brachionichthys hirsutus TaxID=412623 RepID=UPI003604FEC4